MTEWLILALALPLLLLPIYVLFSYSGCAELLELDAYTDATPSPPVAPIDVQAEPVGNSQIRVSWSDASSGDPEFVIRRREQQGVAWSTVVTLPPGSTSHVDASGLTTGLTYCYEVQAKLGSQESAWSDEACATAEAVVGLPNPPSSVTAVAVDDERIDVAWTPDGSAPGLEFKLLRSKDTPDNFVEVPGGPFPASASPVQDFPLDEDTTYHYQVIATNAAGDSAPSMTAAATTKKWLTAFDAEVDGGAETNEPGWQDYCLVQVIPSAVLAVGGLAVRLTLRGSDAGTLQLDAIFISGVSTAPGADPHDSAPDLTEVTIDGLPGTAAPISPGTELVSDKIAYALNPDEPLLIAFDMGPSPDDNSRYSAVTGATDYQRPNTDEAGTQDRSSDYVPVSNRVHVVKRIEVLS